MRRSIPATLLTLAVLASCSSGSHSGHDMSDMGSDSPAQTTNDPADGSMPAGHMHHAATVYAAGDGRGLSEQEGAYRLELLDDLLPGGSATFKFSITKDGSPVTTFKESHGELLHLLAVGGTGIDYQHVHPTMAEDGTWTAELDLTGSAPWRLVVDTMVEEGRLVLGTQVGDGELEFSIADVRRVEDANGDGASVVTAVREGENVDLMFMPLRGGDPVTAVEPYLNAAGHLVLFSQDNAGYWHSHPTELYSTPLTFSLEKLPAGKYVAFLQYKVDREVSTVRFELELD